MQFKDILFYLRESRELTQKAVAEACGVSSTCICQLETGVRNPTGSTLSALADFFGVSTDYLLGRSDDFGNVTIVGQTERPLAREERAVVELFRKLPDDLKKRATAYLEKLVELAEEDGSVSPTVRKA